MNDNLIDSIRAAVADGATAEARIAGVAACRTILTVLEPSGTAPSTAPQTPAIPVAAIAAALRNTSPDQLLDLAIMKLRSLVPADALPATTPRLNIPLIPIRKP